MRNGKLQHASQYERAHAIATIQRVHYDELDEKGKELLRAIAMRMVSLLHGLSRLKACNAHQNDAGVFDTIFKNTFKELCRKIDVLSIIGPSSKSDYDAFDYGYEYRNNSLNANEIEDFVQKHAEKQQKQQNCIVALVKCVRAILHETIDVKIKGRKVVDNGCYINRLKTLEQSCQETDKTVPILDDFFRLLNEIQRVLTGEISSETDRLKE